MTVAPDPVFPKASGGVMAEIGKEASCERGSGAEVVHTSAKDANRRDEIQEILMTDADVSGRLSNGELADLLVRLAREPETHEMKDWPKWKPYILAKLTEAADRLRSPGGDGELVAALRDMPCIRPCNGRPDDFTVGQCCDAGECGCGNAAALSAAEATKDAEDFKQWVAERQPDYKAEATSAPTPAPVSWERDWRALETAAWHLDQANKPALATLVRDAATALRTPAMPGGVDSLRSKPDFHSDPVEQLAFELAFELEEADLKPDDLVTVNREKLRAIAKRILSRLSPASRTE